MKEGPFAINYMRFPNIRSVEQTGQKFSSHSSLSQKNTFKKTSRERPKSAPYLRLKNSKRTSKCRKNVISELVKRYIRTFKMLHPNFENVTSEL